ncbi:acyl-CoA thioesterase [Nocardioides jishulii]|uniref:Acyl-CoA thioesterase II n=1 Tax=Nocardioides jishulii TaxID=2575440 RepID=A0A4V5TMN3_9ACTN|nr:acyl-CoA thioesterase domain-containing protein [Nocardioides jishulii]QCX26521.1 acyl-CoA thioesterase II [Nocardioides jishulii]TKI63673.1 acyl-CoA thioesterase II [Nocardioides jishulii]
MPDHDELLALLDLDCPWPGHLVGGQPPASMLDKVYGGQLLAQALVAMTRTVDLDRRAHAVQGTFFHPGNHVDALHYDVEKLRDGRSFSVRSVVASQDSRELLRATASFQVPEPGLAHSPAAPPAPPPDDLPSLADVIRDHSELDDAPWRREWPGVDVRYVDALLDSPDPTGPGRQQVWMKVRRTLPDDPVLHHQVLTYLSDLTLVNASLVPHGILVGAPELPRATLNHTVWLHEDVRADEWFLVDQTSPWAGGARGFSRAEVFQDGRHVASYAQEGLIRPRGDLRKRLLGDEADAS